MRPATRILLSALALPLAAAPALALQSLASRSYVPATTRVEPAPDPERLQRLLAQADAASVNGRDAEAIKLYKAIAAEQREARIYSGTALWRMAGAQLFQGKVVDAATTLDETAQEAARFGDPTMELRATFEAAILWQKAKRNDVAMSRLERVRDLLRSPVIEEDLKTSVERRIVK
ncbi:MAG: hypothetical protein IT359_11615 [Gemmatimonadaceae bacterium]|nr:hypothetical protein [Gemmatimonadaceae bacterium]